MRISLTVMAAAATTVMDGEQLQQSQLIRDLYDGVADGGDRERTKSIDKDRTSMLCMELDLGLDLGSCSRGGSSSDDGGDSSNNGGDDSGSGDGGSSGVDDSEQLQQSKTKEAAMEQRMVTASGDGDGATAAVTNHRGGEGTADT